MRTETLRNSRRGGVPGGFYFRVTHEFEQAPPSKERHNTNTHLLPESLYSIYTTYECRVTISKRDQKLYREFEETLRLKCRGHFDELLTIHNLAPAESAPYQPQSGWLTFSRTIAKPYTELDKKAFVADVKLATARFKRTINNAKAYYEQE